MAMVSSADRVTHVAEVREVISAIVIAIQMISAFCKKLKYRRKIVLVTNGTSPLDPDNLKEITSKIREDNIDLVIL